jgi:hypothetical protein
VINQGHTDKPRRLNDKLSLIFKVCGCLLPRILMLLRRFGVTGTAVVVILRVCENDE